MKDLNSLLDDHHESMQNMYVDMMEMMGRFMKTSLSGYYDIMSKYADAEEDSESEEEKELEAKDPWAEYQEEDSEIDEDGPEVLKPAVYSASEGVEYDDMGDPIVDSYVESDIDPDAYSYGSYLGLPKTLVLNFNPRGEIDTQIEDG